MLYKSKKFLIIFFLILLVFFFGLIFEHYKLYPRNEIAVIIKKNTLIKTLVNKFKISKLTKQCFANLKNINNDDNAYKNILIIGHSYGNHSGTNNGIYPKLINHLKGQKEEWDYIISAGDSVRVASRNNFAILGLKLDRRQSYFVGWYANGAHNFGLNDPTIKTI